MSRQIETDIFNFMSMHSSASSCLQTYLPFWRARGISPTDINIICHFLYSHNEHEEIIKLSIENLDNDEPISWLYLGLTLKYIEPNLNATLYKLLKTYITDNRKLDEFYVSDLFDLLFPFEGEIKIQQIQRKIQIKDRYRQTLLDQIRVFNQSRNFNIEKQTIQKFAKFFPNDKLSKELLKKFDTEELQRFFKHYKNDSRRTVQLSVELFTTQENELLSNYLIQFKQAFTNGGFYQHSDIDGFIYFFLFIEDYTRALDLLPFMKETSARDWLNLDLLIFNRKYAETLSFIKELDIKYQEEPSFYSTKIYYIAQCFWGLGDRLKAIELMENLIEIKPDYRLASSLLKDWKYEL